MTAPTPSERDRVVHDLREHYSAGRLGAEELKRRLAIALGAELRADLDAALDGLPAIVPAPAGRGPDRAYQGTGGENLQRTDEVFRDPATGRLTRVYEDPVSGARRYIPD